MTSAFTSFLTRKLLRFGRAAALSLSLCVAFAATALAQGTERLGDFQDWSAFRFEESGKPVCYMASQPQRAEGNYSKRGDVYVIITHRPGEGTFDEVSVVAGYSYKKDSTAEMKIGDVKKTLFTQDDAAWAADKETDDALVSAMIRGHTMVVKGTSSRGTLTTDSYSLLGFTKAHQTIDKACSRG